MKFEIHTKWNFLQFINSIALATYLFNWIYLIKTFETNSSLQIFTLNY